MDLRKIEVLHKNILEEMKKDVPDDEEYILCLANLLFSWADTGIRRYTDISVNREDAAGIELAYLANPNNPYLAGYLQAHILVSWSLSLRSNE